MASWLDKPIYRITPKPCTYVEAKHTEAELAQIAEARQKLEEYRAREIERQREFDGRCWVYCLWFPPHKRPFYIGISNNPWNRFDQHRSDPAAGGYPYVGKLLNLGYHRDQILKIYKRCETRREALAIEFRLIETTPKIVNATKGKYGEPIWLPR